MWYAILRFMNMVGVITNACLIAFTSSWGNKYDLTGQLIIVIAFEVRPTQPSTLRGTVRFILNSSSIIDTFKQYKIT